MAVQAFESLGRLALSYQGGVTSLGGCAGHEGIGIMTLRTSRLAAGAAMAATLSLAATPAFADGWGGRHRHHGGDDAGWIIGGLIGIGAIAAIASSANKNKRERDSRYADREEGYPDRDYDSDEQDQADGYASGGDHYVPGVEGSYSTRERDLDGEGDDDEAGPADADQSYRYGDDGGDAAEPSDVRRDEAIDNRSAAVDACTAAVQRDSARVESVVKTTRDGSGWSIAGKIAGGKDFACTIDDDGSVSEATVDGGGVFD